MGNKSSTQPINPASEYFDALANENLVAAKKLISEGTIGINSHWNAL
jgi:hypothetical protein